MVNPQESYGEFRKADITDERETLEAVKGAEILIHCASIHPWKRYRDEQYLDSNVKGTWNVLRAVSENGFKRVILTSSIAASGYDPDPAFRPVDESYQQQTLRDIYSLTKLFQEQIARYFCGIKDIRVIALRPPNFTPKTPLQTGAALLSGCLLVEDIATAHIKALDAWDKLQDAFEPFFIAPTFPYSQEEIAQLQYNPRDILDKHFPGAWDWFERHNVKLRLVETLYSSRKAKRILDWQPQHDFEWWWRENREKL
jgi:hypothetical protein